MQVLHPLSMDHMEIEVCEASPYGVGVRCPIFVAPGSEVKIRIGDRMSFGQVRYCIPMGNEFRVGVKIRDIF